MSTEIRSAIDYYERHPISSEIILHKLKTTRGSLNNVAPEELFPHDQDIALDVLDVRFTPESVHPACGPGGSHSPHCQP